MADGGLTLREFWQLSEEERCKRYKDLSDHDKLGVRITMPSGPPVHVPCNECANRIRGKPACKAFPDGLTADHIRAVMEDPDTECGPGIHFDPK